MMSVDRSCHYRIYSIQNPNTNKRTIATISCNYRLWIICQLQKVCCCRYQIIINRETIHIIIPARRKFHSCCCNV